MNWKETLKVLMQEMFPVDLLLGKEHQFVEGLRQEVAQKKVELAK